MAQAQYTFDKISTSRCRFSGLPLLALKFTKFLTSFLEPRVSFPSNFASLFIVMRRDSSVLFHLKLWMLCTKGAHQSADFQTFQTQSANFQCRKLVKFLMLFFKSRASFLLNFASHFSVTTHNSYEIFLQKHMVWTKSAHQSTIFQTLECSNGSLPNSSCHFWKHKVKVYSNFTSLFNWKLFCLGGRQKTYLGEGRVCLREQE